MSILSKIGKIASWAAPIAATVMTGGAAAPTLFGKIASMAGPISQGIGAMTSAAGKNRGTNVDIAFKEEEARRERERLRQGDDTIAINAGNLTRQQIDDYHNQSRLREIEGREGRGQAMKDIQVANYVGNRGEAPPAMTTSGKQLNTMGLGPRASTEQEKAGMAAAAQEIMTRLQGGNPLDKPEMAAPVVLPGAGKPRLYDEQFGIDPKLTKPGLMERIGGIAGPLLGAAGSIWGKPKVPGEPGFNDGTLPSRRAPTPFYGAPNA